MERKEREGEVPLLQN